MSSQNLISLTSVSNVRLEHFRAQQELARNFYDDQEFCPLTRIEEATEHRERIQKRTSPQPSPNYSFSASSCYYTSPIQPQSHQYYHPQSTQSRPSSANSSTGNRAIPIIDPSNMTPVSVPTQSTNGSTFPSIAQWPAYSSNLPANISPSSSHSSIGSSSSSSSSTTSSNNSETNNYISNNHIKTNSNHYYFNNCAINYQYQTQKQITPVVARTIPIVDPTTRQVFHHQRHHQQQQNPNIPPGFYNVSVC